MAYLALAVAGFASSEPELVRVAAAEIRAAPQEIHRKAFGWARVIGVHAIGIAVVMLALHSVGGGLRHH